MSLLRFHYVHPELPSLALLLTYSRDIQWSHCALSTWLGTQALSPTAHKEMNPVNNQVSDLGRVSSPD